VMSYRFPRSTALQWVFCYLGVPWRASKTGVVV
jgi:hypothetical protein